MPINTRNLEEQQREHALMEEGDRNNVKMNELKLAIYTCQN